MIILNPHDRPWLEWYTQLLRTQEKRHPEEANLNSGLKCALAIALRYQGHGLSLPDLVGSANLGLTQALNKYDPVKNPKFLPYARTYIYGALNRDLRHAPRERIFSQGDHLK